MPPMIETTIETEDRPLHPQVIVTKGRGRPKPAEEKVDGAEVDHAEPSDTAEPKSALEQDEEVREEGKEKAVKGSSAALNKFRNAAEYEVKAWLDGISGAATMKVALIRVEPKTHRDPNTGETVKTNGTLDTYNRAIDEEEVQRIHGGGTYQVVVQTKAPTGRWAFFGSKTFEIAGDPNLAAIPRTVQRPDQTNHVPQPDNSGTNKALDRMVDFAIGQANRPAQQVSTGLSSEAVAAMIKPLEVQITTLTTMLRDKETAHAAELKSIRETAGKDPFRDKMLESMMDGESARINALRVQHQSELSAFKEGARQDLEREREHHKRELERIERAHEREIAMVKSANEQAISHAVQKADVTKLVLEREVHSIEKQLVRVDTENAALRAKKDKSIKEQVEEISAIKKLVEGDSDGDEDESPLAQVLNVLGNLPVVAKMAERMQGGGQAAPAQPQAIAAPAKPKLVRDRNTGEVMRLHPDGTREPAKRRPQTATTAEGQQVEIPTFDPEQVKQAITYMEGAFRSKTSPEQFAASARPFLPAPMLGAMRTLGVVDFLIQVGKIDGTSCLSTMAGRQWAKKVAKELLGEEREVAPEAEVAPPASPELAVGEPVE